jgi:tetratricopeptide (TPR) repeat protein
MALKIGKIKHKPGIRLTGPIYISGPFARFNRELSASIIQSGDYDLGLQPEDLVLRKEGVLSPVLESRIQRQPVSLKYELIHQGVPPEMPVSDAQWIHMLPWEYGSSPLDWHATLLYTSDQVWVHTPENYALYQSEGIAEERLALIPAGVNPEIFNPQIPPLRLPGRRKFCFLFSGEALWYSGIDQVLKAYIQEFLPDEDVTLIIRDHAWNQSQDRENMQAVIRQYQADPDNPPLIYLDRSMSLEEEAQLYRACQAMLSPFRAEAFGLYIFEAMACGLPVVLTKTEHRLGIEPEDINIWLQSRQVKATEKQLGGFTTLGYPSWYENNLSELRFQMRELFENAASFEAMGARASHWVHEHRTWKQTYATIHNRLQAMSGKPIFRIEQTRLQEKTLQGLEYLHAGESAQALEQLEAVIAEDPNNPLLHLDVGSILLRTGKYSEALQHFQECFKYLTHNANLFSVVGIALYHLKAYQLAERFFLQALSLQPEHSGAGESLKSTREALAQQSAAEPEPDFPEWEAILKQHVDMSRPQTLSLCMIVKNEERFLRTCLESVRDVVDEIIVVDTGSSDKTVEIAREMGAKVFFFEWTGSFADARNCALDHATSDWILVLDADEVVTPETVHNIRELIQIPQPNLTGYQLKIRNFSMENNEVDTIEHFMMRLFPRHPELRFSGYIHEQVKPVHDSVVFERLTTTDVLLLHYGYTGTMMTERDKFKRNLALIEASLQQEPENPFHSFNLGLTYRVNRDNQKTLQAFLDAIEKSSKLENQPTYMASCWCYVASVYLELGEIEKAQETCEKAPALSYTNPDYWLNYGSVWTHLGHYDQAIEAYQKAIALRHADFTSLVSDRAATTWKPYAGIGNVYLMQGNLDKADHYFRRALRENPESSDIRLGLVRLCLFRNKPREARAYMALNKPEDLTLQQTWEFALENGRSYAIEGDVESAEKCFQALLAEENLDQTIAEKARIEIGNLYLQQNRLEESAEILQNAANSIELVKEIALFHYQNGAMDKVQKIYSELIERNHGNQASDFCHRGIAFLQQGKLNEAQADFEKALSLNPNHPDTLHNLGVIALKQQNVAQARAFFEKNVHQNPDFAISFLDLARIECSEHRSEQAIELLRQALACKSGKSKADHKLRMDILMLLASLEAEAGNVGEASVHYMDVLDIKSDHIDALLALGYLLLGAEEYGQALQLFEHALNYGDHSARLYKGIGLIFIEQAKYEDARHAFMLAWQAEPGNAEIEKALQMLNQFCEPLTVT